FERLEHRIAEAENKIDFFVRTSLPPVEGIFYDGQMLEPFEFINRLVRSAKKRIVLIDNYVDDTVLLRLAERGKKVSATIFTQNTSPSFFLAIEKYNKQFAPITVHKFAKSHDRFLIIDQDVYHIGASIKDLGKRWFAFCKMQLNADEMIDKII
ncbi:MAG: DNA-binding protein, partial [Bacteroidales bacterium]|nr:DNA-binding protein [Bacteroidales bacterium]